MVLILLAEELGLRVCCGLTRWFGPQPSGGRGHNPKRLQGSQRRSRHEDSLRIGSRVGEGEKQSVILNKRICEANIEVRKALQFILVAEGQLQPETVSPGPCRERLAPDSLGIHVVIKIEIPHISYCLDVIDRLTGYAPIDPHQSYPPGVQKSSLRKVPPHKVTPKRSKNHFLLCRSHRSGAPILPFATIIVQRVAKWPQSM